MENYANGKDIPMGFGMALAQNEQAMEYFARLPKERQQEIINGTHTIHSKKEMKNYVGSIIT